MILNVRETGRTGYKIALIEKLQMLYPGIMILPQDPIATPGIPDLLLLYQNKWAALETKASNKSKIRPRQPYYVDLMNSMSFAAFIYPENEEDVLYDLQQTFCGGR